MSASAKGIQVGVALGVLALWEGLGRSGLILRELFPPFSEVAIAAFHLLEGGSLGEHAAVSSREIGLGFLAGAGLAVLCGAPMGANPFLYRLFEPLLYYLGAVPKIILFPIFLWFLGTGMGSKVGMSAVSAFFPVIVNTALAVREVRPVHVRAARALGAGRWQLCLKVYLPSMLGPILSGLRLGLGVAIVGALLAETAVARAGLGFRAIELYAQFAIAEMYALVLLIFLGAVLLNALISWLAGRATRWQGPSQGGFF